MTTSDIFTLIALIKTALQHEDNITDIAFIADNTLAFRINGEPVTVTISRKSTKDITRKDGKVIPAFNLEEAVAAYEAKRSERTAKAGTSKTAQAKAAKAMETARMLEALVGACDDQPRNGVELATIAGLPEINAMRVGTILKAAIADGRVKKVEKDKHVAYVAG